LKGVSAASGGDGAADVCGALEAAGSLSWDKQVGSSLLYHIADASCHGSFFHDGTCYDNHSGFDPDGSKTKSALQKLTNKGMSEYVFLKISGETDRMIVQFSHLLGRKIDTVDIRSADVMMTAIASRSIASISAKSRVVSCKILEDESSGKKLASILKQKMGSILETPVARTPVARASLSATAALPLPAEEEGYDPVEDERTTTVEGATAVQGASKQRFGGAVEHWGGDDVASAVTLTCRLRALCESLEVMGAPGRVDTDSAVASLTLARMFQVYFFLSFLPVYFVLSFLPVYIFLSFFRTRRRSIPTTRWTKLSLP
jgi:hypothetical protein